MRRLRAFVAFATLGLLWHSAAAATTTTPRDGVRRLLRQAAASYYYASEATVGRQLMQVETVTIPLGGRGQVPWGDMFTFDTPPVAPGAEGALPTPDALMHAAESFLSEPTTNALGNGGALMDEACSPIVRKAMNAAPESAFFPKAAKDVYNNFCDPVASAEAPAEGDALAQTILSSVFGGVEDAIPPALAAPANASAPQQLAPPPHEVSSLEELFLPLLGGRHGEEGPSAASVEEGTNGTAARAESTANTTGTDAEAEGMDYIASGAAGGGGEGGERGGGPVGGLLPGFWQDMDAFERIFDFEEAIPAMLDESLQDAWGELGTPDQAYEASHPMEPPPLPTPLPTPLPAEQAQPSLSDIDEEEEEEEDASSSFFAGDFTYDDSPAWDVYGDEAEATEPSHSDQTAALLSSHSLSPSGEREGEGEGEGHASAREVDVGALADTIAAISLDARHQSDALGEPAAALEAPPTPLSLPLASADPNPPAHVLEAWEQELEREEGGEEGEEGEEGKEGEEGGATTVYTVLKKAQSERPTNGSDATGEMSSVEMLPHAEEVGTPRHFATAQKQEHKHTQEGREEEEEEEEEGSAGATSVEPSPGDGTGKAKGVPFVTAFVVMVAVVAVAAAIGAAYKVYTKRRERKVDFFEEGEGDGAGARIRPSPRDDDDEAVV